jgi:16S rRNA U516 pseudouridylate synthase RsuA-like enzyme
MPSIEKLSTEKLIARNLGCSRAQARDLLGRAGDLPRELLPADLPYRLLVGGRVVELHDRFHLMLHKPLGCVTALADGRHPSYARSAA